jgi:hypothetical protein
MARIKVFAEKLFYLGQETDPETYTVRYRIRIRQGQNVLEVKSDRMRIHIQGKKWKDALY